MKKILFIAFIFLFLKVDAQNIVISFSSTKSDEKIDSVLVENLSQGKSVVLKGATNLELTASAVTLVSVYGLSSQFKVYPNPVSDNCFLQFNNNEAGNVIVGLYDLTGKQLIGRTEFLDQGIHSFQLSGLPFGISVVKIVGADFNFTGKIISTGKGLTDLSLKYSSTSGNEEIPTQLKSATTNTLMQYNTVERLKYTIYSNGNSTVQTDVPTQSKTVASTFYEAKDADGNNYATVQIGTQTWMAENLKTTKYRDGSPTPNVTDNNAWGNLTTGAYCNYKNDAAIGTLYGKLYNWYAAISSKNLAPTGWHVPTDAEWSTMENYLIANGSNYDGSKTDNKIAKALAATTDWLISTKTGAIGNDLTKNNTTGFTALPGGNRAYDGTYMNIGYGGYWWSSSEGNTDSAWYRGMYYYGSRMYSSYYVLKLGGFSVRCIKD